jgi:Uncharacterised protein family (UPF0175)
MTISFELPPDIEQLVSTNGADLNHMAREAFLVELYREKKITQHQLGQALGLDDYETDGVLKRHGVGYDLMLDEFEEQRTFLRRNRQE